MPPKTSARGAVAWMPPKTPARGAVAFRSPNTPDLGAVAFTSAKNCCEGLAACALPANKLTARIEAEIRLFMVILQLCGKRRLAFVIVRASLLTRPHMGRGDSAKRAPHEGVMNVDQNWMH